MNDAQKRRLKELDDKPSRTPSEQNLREALMRLDEKVKTKADQKDISDARKIVFDAEEIVGDAKFVLLTAEAEKLTRLKTLGTLTQEEALDYHRLLGKEKRLVEVPHKEAAHESKAEKAIGFHKGGDFKMNEVKAARLKVLEAKVTKNSAEEAELVALRKEESEEPKA